MSSDDDVLAVFSLLLILKNKKNKINVKSGAKSG